MSARHTHEHLLMDAATDELKQYTLADRALNPSTQVGSLNNSRKNLGKDALNGYRER